MNKPTIPSLEGYATEGYVDGEILASLEGYATEQYVDTEIFENQVTESSVSG